MYKCTLEELCNEKALSFYNSNKNVPLDKLLFKYAKSDYERSLSIQIEARRRAKSKLPTWFSTKNVVFPPKANLEQASSEITANYKAGIIPFKTSVDLTGGSGIDSWAFALSAEKHEYIEPNSDLIKLAQHNFHAFGIKNTRFFCSTAEKILSELEKVDLIYLDPLRRIEGSRKIALNQYSPDVTQMLDELLSKASHVLIKVSPLTDIAYLAEEFRSHLQAIHIVAVKNECKEVLIQLSNETQSEFDIKTINFQSEGEQIFEFSSSELNAIPSYSNQFKKYLFEPNAAVLKSGAFNYISTSFEIYKIHNNSHLYTSNKLIEDFPGKVYRIIEEAAPYRLSNKYNHLSIAARNYPEPVDRIRKKLKVKESETVKLFATQLGERKVFIVGEKVVG